MRLGDVDELASASCRRPARRRGDADVEPPVGLPVHADVVTVAERLRRRGRRRRSGRSRYSFSSTSRNLLDAPVGHQELEPGPAPQPAVAVVAEQADDAAPDVGDLVERHPDAQALREHRVGREPAADPDVEADPCSGCTVGDEGEVVDLGCDVEAAGAR